MRLGIGFPHGSLEGKGGSTSAKKSWAC
jgi:hypothetical protein